MESPFKSPVPQPADNGNTMVIQQFARYPPLFETPLRSGSPGSTRSRLAASHSPPLRRKETPRSLQSSPRGPLSGVMTSSGLRTGISMSPPPIDTNSRRAIPRDSVGDAERRILPPRDVTDETIDDAYVAFIMYCNPNVPISTDSSELRKTFRGPPRSDGKSFSVFILWELIRKLDRKELKTWIQLAIELGVEPPSLEKKQSTQKVQQYAVRLKRWMRAMHVDAFFEYLLGHDHSYFKQLPAFNGPACEDRDGVPLEEDLALRALVPEWKPKRGRKRADEKDREDARYPKRPQLDTSMTVLDGNALAAHAANFPHSAIPFSAFPDDIDPNDPWAAAASSFGTDQQVGTLAAPDLRWRPFEGDGSPPGFPRSAVIPRNHETESAPVAEPRSAVTPSSREKSRSRRRHGPAVSSAWPSNTGSMTGKVRGRPPNRGSAPGGPFSSFPANPARSNTPNHMASVRSSPAMGVDNISLAPPRNQTPNSMGNLHMKPERLQLHVPQSTGRPVRLATPPTLVLNGANDASARFDHLGGRRASIATSNDIDDAASLPSMITDRGLQLGQPTKVSIDDVTRAVAGRILRAKIIGRSTSIEVDEARALANVAVQRICSIYSMVPIDSIATFCALYFGVAHRLGLARVSPGSFTVKIIQPPDNGSLVVPTRSTQTYTLVLESRPGHGFGFNSTLSDLSLAPGQQENVLHRNTETLGFQTEDDEFGNDDDFGGNESMDEGSWKQRYMRLRHQMRRKESALREYKKNILQSVMADL
ncbi:putative ARS binding protein Abp2 [Talaromyces proteolyticus]|uniref:ARS binding protein Abp2 n=1 Tax=Talaromyces proteolyticus TaxID=1131652 RepID=A0AAD4KTU6_9EURO|nr:putative ARS binding protein Abp2 [Talaromyces proteolyticus]KAH8698334.1 putative ARS binding protein Abp2 [Talaromyces proteolyticus]